MRSGRAARRGLVAVLTVAGVGLVGGGAHAADRPGGARPAAVAPAHPGKAAGHAAPASTASPTPLVVLTLDTEDYGDQAEALSGALRSRVRATRGFQLVETQTSFAMFLGALACPPKPDAGCLKKIAEQLKVDRFMWGTITKAGPGQVTAEVHLWDRGQDAVQRQTFSDNLKDQNDEVLHRIAERLFGALTGTPVGTMVDLRLEGIGTKTGAVWVDGADAGVIENGHARFEVPPGRRSLSIQVAGFRPDRRVVDARAGADLALDVTLVPDAQAEAPPPSRPISARTVLALGSLGVGVGFGVAGTVEAVRFLSRQSQNQDDHKNINATDFCDPTQPHTGTDAELDAACQNLKSAKSARLLEAVFYGVSAVFIGTGAVLLITDHGDARDDAPPAGTKGARSSPVRFSFEPHAGPGAGGLDLRLTF